LDELELENIQRTRNQLVQHSVDAGNTVGIDVIAEALDRKKSAQEVFELIKAGRSQ